MSRFIIDFTIPPNRKLESVGSVSIQTTIEADDLGEAVNQFRRSIKGLHGAAIRRVTESGKVVLEWNDTT